MTKVPDRVVANCCGQNKTTFIATLFFFLPGVASLWRAHFSDLDYSWPAASSGLLILDEFLNGLSSQVRDQVLDSIKCSSQCVSCLEIV